ncbi:hypothetical protein ZWY2020_014322 [Hordeum vulgare]|nr:hypothetical protein ZWY2020_014322 [Hordeum vulgare]
MSAASSEISETSSAFAAAALSSVVANMVRAAKYFHVVRQEWGPVRIHTAFRGFLVGRSPRPASLGPIPAAKLCVVQHPFLLCAQPQDFQHCKVSLGKSQQPARVPDPDAGPASPLLLARRARLPRHPSFCAEAFPEAPSEQDPGIMLNTAARGTNLLGWFLLLCRGSGFQIFIVITSQICLENLLRPSLGRCFRQLLIFQASTVLSQYFAALLPAQQNGGALGRNAAGRRATGQHHLLHRHHQAACRPGKAVEWFEKMPETGCSPDMLMYSVLIDTYGRAGDAEMALRLDDNARSERCQLDPVICATVIKVHSTNSNFDDALNVLEEMKVVGVKPTLVVYNTVLDAMGHAMRLWVVKTIHREMVNQKVQPNRATYCCLLQAYTRARYGEDPKIVYRKMKEEVMDIDMVL